MKTLKKCLIIFIAVIFALYLGRGIVVKNALQIGARAATGLKLKIGKLKIGANLSKIQIKDMKLYNPKGFKDKVMIDIPEVSVDVNSSALFKGKIHVREVRFNLEQFTIVKNKKGESNLEYLKNVGKKDGDKKEKPKKTKKKESKDFQIDRLYFRVNKVVFKDYSKDEPYVREVNINLEEEHDNIKSPELLVGLIVVKIMAKTAFASLVNVDMDGLSSFVDGGLKGASEAASKALAESKEAMRKTSESLKKSTEGLKDLLPFGSK